MIYIKDFALFLNEIRKEFTRINNLRSYISEKNDIDNIGILIPTEETISINEYVDVPYVKSFYFRKQYRREKPDKYSFFSKKISYHDLVLFSVDNKKYFYYSNDRGTKNPYSNIYTEITEKEDDEGFTFYLCDITKSFYTRINCGKDYYHIFEKLNSDIWCEFYDGFQFQTIYAHNCPVLYYYCKSNEEIIPFNQIKDVTVFGFNGKSLDEKIFDLYYKNAKKDIFDIDENTIDYENDEFIIEKAKAFLARTDDLIKKHYVPLYSIFGKNYDFCSEEDGYDSYLLLTDYLKSFVFILNEFINSYSLNSDFIKANIKKVLSSGYDILVKDSIEKDLELEAVVENIRRLLSEYESFCNKNILFSMRNVFLAKKEYYLYNGWARNNRDLLNEIINPYDDDSLAELFTTGYTNQFYEEILGYIGEVNQAQDDIENFSGGFTGGGFGFSGAAKGILMATAANAISGVLYSAHKYHKLYSKKTETIINEFLKTEKSKNYIREMMVFDLKYLLMKSMYIFSKAGTNSRLYVETAETFGVYGGEQFFNAFVKSSKIYSIALAKIYNLALLPEYEGFDEYYQMQPKQLLEEAIFVFPYDSSYYEKYMDLGGEITAELSDFAAICMIDLSSVRQRYETRQKVQRELDEKLRKEEEERKRKEQEAEAERLRKEQEAKEAAQKKLAEIFGDIAKDYADLFSLMSDNPIYLSNPDKHFNSHNELTAFIFYYINENFKGVTTSMFPASSSQFSQKLRNLQNIHGYQVITKENALFCFDNTVFGSGKDGFVLTRNALCYRNIMESPVHVPLKSIKTMKVVNGEICINDNKKINVALCKLKKSDLLNVLNYCICNLLVMPEPIAPQKPEMPENNTVNNPQNSTNQKSSFQFINKIINYSTDNKQNNQTNVASWRCSCGATNDETCFFCPTCGAKHIKEIEEWTCTSCGRKNPNQFVFCGSCGTKKEPIKKDWYCTSCGTRNPATSVFCGACGKKSE